MTNCQTNLELYEKLIAQFPQVERKGKTMPYTSMNGHMSSFLDKEGTMGLRLSKEDLDTFIQEHDGFLMQQHGRVMKEYVVISQSLLENTEQLKNYFEMSYAYVGSLIPKATKKK